MKCQFI